MTNGRKTLTYHFTYVAMCIAILTVSAWITVPFVINFSLQTLAVFWIAAVSHWKQSITAILLYLTLGSLGAPVFSGFQGGFSVLLHTTGGYLVGFLAATLIIGLAVRFFGKTQPVLWISMLLALTVCYGCGTAWYMILYSRADEPVSLVVAFSTCVLPFLLPDLAKTALAILLTRRMEPYLLRLHP